MIDILNYRGDADLGLGSNPGIPAIANTNLKVISDTARDVMLLNNERNILQWKQKVSDRDKLNELVLQNQVDPGEIKKEYQPYFDRAKSDVEKEYIKWGGNMNDTEGFRKYQDKVGMLKDLTAHARVKTLGLQALQQQAAKETLPWKKQKIQDFIDQQNKKGFWDQVDPYQELYSFNIDPINKLYKTGTTLTRSPDGVTTYEDTYGDYAQTLKNAQNEFVNQGETAEDMQQWYQHFDAYDLTQKRKAIEAVNGQLQKYNQERGLVQGQDGYVDPLKTLADPQNPGNMRLAEPIQDFSAKWAVSQQEKFLTRTPKIDYKLLAADVAKQRANTDANYKNRMANAAADRAWALVDKWKSQKGQLQGQEQVANQKYLDLVGAIDEKSVSNGRINADNIPESRQFMGGIVYDAAGKKQLGRVYPKLQFWDEDGVVKKDEDLSFDSYSNDVKDKKTKIAYPDWAKQKAKDKGYRIESFYDTKYLNPEGREITSPQDLAPNLLKGFAKAQKDYGINFNQYLKGLSKLGAIMVQFQGSNGTGNPGTILEGSRFEQSQYGKKGFEGVYSPEDSAIPEDLVPDSPQENNDQQ